MGLIGARAAAGGGQKNGPRAKLIMEAQASKRDLSAQYQVHISLLLKTFAKQATTAMHPLFFALTRPGSNRH
jgi:hypothetical protein